MIVRVLKLASENSITGERRKLNALDLFRATQLSGLSLQFENISPVNTDADDEAVSVIGVGTSLVCLNTSLPERPEPHYYKETMVIWYVDCTFLKGLGENCC